MNSVPQRIKNIFDALSKERGNPKIDKSIDWLTFLIGLLPDVLVVGKISTIANKWINDQAIERKFQAIAEKFNSTNARISEIDNHLDRLDEITRTASTNTSLQSSIKEMLDELHASSQSGGSGFNASADDWSSQSIIDTFIKSDWVRISATNNSNNLVQGSRIESKSTSLIAKNKSSNVIRDSEFTDGISSVGFQGSHRQTGSVKVTGASIGYGDNSTTQMAGWSMGTDAQGNFFIGTRNPDFTASCPKCKKSFDLYKADIAGKTNLCCPHCGMISGIPRGV